MDFQDRHGWDGDKKPQRGQPWQLGSPSIYQWMMLRDHHRRAWLPSPMGLWPSSRCCSGGPWVLRLHPRPCLPEHHSHTHCLAPARTSSQLEGRQSWREAGRCAAHLLGWEGAAAKVKNRLAFSAPVGKCHVSRSACRGWGDECPSLQVVFPKRFWTFAGPKNYPPAMACLSKQCHPRAFYLGTELLYPPPHPTLSFLKKT